MPIYATPLQNVPDIFQGYGRVNLAKLLPLQGHATNPYTLFVDQKDLKNLTELVYTVTVKSTSEDFKITLSWYDPPTAEFAARNIIHDLDLVVVSPSSIPYYGNTVVTDAAYTGIRDELNNVRQCVRSLALPCLALPCLALPCLALPCLALPCLALPCLALPCLALHCST